MIKLPKIIKTFYLTVFICLSVILIAQPSFTINSSVCVGDNATLTANPGTYPATGFQWLTSPMGPVFSTPNFSITQISFPTTGIYTITLSISAGNSTLYAIQAVTVHSVPVLTLSSTAASICANQSVTLTASGAASYTWVQSATLYFFSNSSAYDTPNVTSVYSISGSSLGCIGTTSYTVDVKNYPTLVLNASSNSVCAGFNATLTANGATSYTWTSSALATAVVQQTIAGGAGIYSIVGANGVCKDSTSIVITAAPPLTLTAHASRNTICVNDGDSLVPVNLSAAGGTLYSWAPYSPGRMTYSLGATTAVSPSISTCYTLTGITAVCVATTAICVNVSTCTSLGEIGTQNSLTIFPNPVINELFLAGNNYGVYTVTLFDIMGRMILEKKLEINPGTPQALILEGLTQGVYLVQMSGSGETPRIVRIVKQ